MAKEKKYDIEYLYMRYKKYYRKGDMIKAREYSDLSMRIHKINLEHKFHEYLAGKEERSGTFGIGKYKRIKYG